MSEPYRQCKECGKRALEFATRCPGCGVALPNPVPFEPDAGPDLGRFLSLKVVFAVVATGTLLASFQRGAVRAATPNAETSFVDAKARFDDCCRARDGSRGCVAHRQGLDQRAEPPHRERQARGDPNAG